MDHRAPEGRQRGQVMVLFLLGIFAIIAMVGLVLDGGSVFAQRRDQQTAADLAAMAGAAAYLNATGTEEQRVAYAESIAVSVANANGYVEGTNGVDIAFAMHTGAFFTDAVVNLVKPHNNNFAALVGMATWDVGVTATARASWQANGARGAMPLMFNAEAFPGAICNDAIETCTPTVYQLPPPGSEDVPQDATSFNFTVFCTASGDETMQHRLGHVVRPDQRRGREYRRLPRRHDRTAQRRRSTPRSSSGRPRPEGRHDVPGPDRHRRRRRGGLGLLQARLGRGRVPTA